jgi:hypothetical protein
VGVKSVKVSFSWLYQRPKADKRQKKGPYTGHASREGLLDMMLSELTPQGAAYAEHTKNSLPDLTGSD